MNCKLLLMFLSLSSFIKSYVNKIYVFENENQKLVLFSDFHYSATNPNQDSIIDEVGIRQAQDILKCINNPKESLLIVEMHDETKVQQCIKIIKKYDNRFQPRIMKTFLGEIRDSFAVNNIPTINVEFRTYLHLTKFLQENNYDELLNTIKFEIDNNFKELESYNDNQFLNEYYSKVIKGIKRKVNILFAYPFNRILNKNIIKNSVLFTSLGYSTFWLYQFSRLINDAYNYKVLSSSLSALKILFGFYSYIWLFQRHMDFSGDNNLAGYFNEFIDAGILHHIYSNKNKKLIFVCAGGQHINKILNSQALDYLGYKLINQSSNEYFNNCETKYHANIYPIDIKRYNLYLSSIIKKQA